MRCEEKIVQKQMRRSIRKGHVAFDVNGVIKDFSDDQFTKNILDTFMVEREKVYEKRKNKIATELKEEHKKLMTRAIIIKTFVDGVWCANDLMEEHTVKDLCGKVTRLTVDYGNHSIQIQEKDFDVSIRKLNQKEYDRLIKKPMPVKKRGRKLLILQ